MAYPAGVITRSISFGSAVAIETAERIEMHVAIKASRSLVWTATGTPLISIGGNFTSTDGFEQVVTLPVTNQPGWSDGQGGAILAGGEVHSHTYVATIDYKFAASTISSVKAGPFVLPSELSGPLDIDNLIPATSGGGAVVQIPDTWSQQIAAAQAAVQAAMNVLTDDFPNAVGAEMTRAGSPARVALLAAAGLGDGEGGEGIGPIQVGTTPPSNSTQGRFYIQKAAE